MDCRTDDIENCSSDWNIEKQRLWSDISDAGTRRYNTAQKIDERHRRYE